MPNHLIHENSPYLLQHADNPVEWFAWGPEALAKARAEDKPIFLSIGYAACHWCHVMAHESFEDLEAASILNENFINIKVDREERPDLDSIYMQAVVAMTGQGGWPMNVFLTPDGQPFYGGTYFPPTKRFNLPSFREVLLAIARLWQQDRVQLLTSAGQITAHLQSSSQLNVDPSMTGNLDQVVPTLEQSYDWQDGGWGSAPKFPQPMVIEFLLRRATRGDDKSMEMAKHALQAMAKGGMYDVVGGGFARYSTDNQWHIPHFEKMLSDNAQLALVYLHAYLITGYAQYRRICEESLDFVRRELTGPEGGFYSSLDADSPGGEGAYYAWNISEIREVVPDLLHQSIIISAYGISDNGNFSGKNILQRTLSDDQLASNYNLPASNVPALLSSLHQKLLLFRQSRPRPPVDDKIILFWNALMLNVFAEAGRYLQRDDYIQMAMRNARFLLENLHLDNRLLRSWRFGQARHNAFLEDYASLILALLSLYQTDPDPHWFSSAERLTHDMLAQFHDPEHGFFDTRADHELLLLRPKNVQDNATPSGNALAAMALLQMSAYTGNTDWRDQADKMLDHIRPLACRYPTAFGQWLTALDYAQGPTFEVAVLTNPAHHDQSLYTSVLWNHYRPRLVAAISPLPIPAGAPPLLRDRFLVDNQTTAYVCQNNACLNPVTSAAEMEKLLPSIDKSGALKQ